MPSTSEGLLSFERACGILFWLLHALLLEDGAELADNALQIGEDIGAVVGSAGGAEIGLNTDFSANSLKA